ncbi:hypothetical protein IWX49DRAFT_636825 [Phyllosticta citricarpa]
MSTKAEIGHKSDRLASLSWRTGDTRVSGLKCSGAAVGVKHISRVCVFLVISTPIGQTVHRFDPLGSLFLAPLNLILHSIEAWAVANRTSPQPLSHPSSLTLPRRASSSRAAALSAARCQQQGGLLCRLSLVKGITPLTAECKQASKRCSEQAVQRRAYIRIRMKLYCEWGTASFPLRKKHDAEIRANETRGPPSTARPLLKYPPDGLTHRTTVFSSKVYAISLVDRSTGRRRVKRNQRLKATNFGHAGLSQAIERLAAIESLTFSCTPLRTMVEQQSTTSCRGGHGSVGLGCGRIHDGSVSSCYPSGVESTHHRSSAMSLKVVFMSMMSIIVRIDLRTRCFREERDLICLGVD